MDTTNTKSTETPRLTTDMISDHFNFWLDIKKNALYLQEVNGLRKYSKYVFLF